MDSYSITLISKVIPFLPSFPSFSFFSFFNRSSYRRTRSFAYTDLIFLFYPFLPTERNDSIFARTVIDNPSRRWCQPRIEENQRPRFNDTMDRRRSFHLDRITDYTGYTQRSRSNDRKQPRDSFLCFNSIYPFLSLCEKGRYLSVAYKRLPKVTEHTRVTDKTLTILSR